MDQREHSAEGGARFGQYLRTLRLDRRLTLERIEEVSRRGGTPVSKTYLSRVEHGHTTPTLPRLEALARIFRIRVGEMAERFEVEAEMARSPGAVPIAAAEPLPESEDEAAAASRGAVVLLDASRRALADPQRLEWARSRLCLAVASSSVGNFRLCKEEAEALVSAPELPDDIRLKAMVQLALAYQRLRRPLLARLVTAALLDRGDDLPSQIRADAHFLMGRIDLDCLEPRSALIHLRQAVASYRKQGPNADLARGLLELGEAYRALGQLPEAMVRYQEGLEIARRADQKPLVADLLSRLGRGHRLLGNRVAALRSLHESNDIARRSDQYDVLFRNHYHLRTLSAESRDEFSRRASERALKLLAVRCSPLSEEALAWRAERAAPPAAREPVALADSDSVMLLSNS